MAAERRNDGALAPAPKLKRPLELASTQASKDMSSALDLDVQRVIAQTVAIQKVMTALMQPGVHYGVVPGTERKDKDGKDISKPSLYQAGADKLCLLFRLRPVYKIRRTETEDFIGFEVRCQLFHIVTGELWGEGVGSCNSREAKYANQSTAKICPLCKKPAIIKGKSDYGGGWLCYAKKDGCGAKFPDDAKEIVNQTGQILAGKAWDQHNAILKISCKRSKTAAVLTATAASDIFTQDLEDLEPDEVPPEPPAGTAATPPATAKPAASQPAAAQSQPTAGNGGGRATPVQTRDLNMALAEMGVGVDEAEERKLTGRAREDFVMEERLKWCSGVLGAQVTSMQALSSVDAARLLAAARGR